MVTGETPSQRPIMRVNDVFLKTHLPLVPHICVSESDQYWFRWWLVAYSVPSHYLSQCRVIVNWTLTSTLQWKFNQNTKLLIHENASENIVREIATILSSGTWGNICFNKPLNIQSIYRWFHMSKHPHHQFRFTHSLGSTENIYQLPMNIENT